MQTVLCFIRQGGNFVFLNSSLNFPLLRGPLDLPRSRSRKNSVEMTTYCFIARSQFSPYAPADYFIKSYRDARCQLPFIISYRLCLEAYSSKDRRHRLLD